MSVTTDFNNYIFGVEPQIDIKITRYLKNKFIIYLTFYTDFGFNEEVYSGMIEFTFDLNDYLEKNE